MGDVAGTFKRKYTAVQIQRKKLCFTEFSWRSDTLEPLGNADSILDFNVKYY